MVNLLKSPLPGLSYLLVMPLSAEESKKMAQHGQWKNQKEQEEYKIIFCHAIVEYLDFHSDVEDLATDLATRITEHATPVGSNTVARTKTIPLEQRAEAATIAWMRHQTTAYDNMHIPREKGKRREVRRMLAKRSKQILDTYRSGKVDLMNCPLYTALS